MPSQSTNSALAYRDIYEQYHDEASFLWVLRSVAVNQPHYTAADINELDRRVEAQLNGLLTSIDLAWEICEEALSLEQPGEVFVSAIIAFKSGDMSKIQKTVEAGLINDDTFKGLVSALGWLPSELCHPWIKKFLTSKDISHKYLALAACSVRREDPADYLTKILQREDCLANQKLYARAMRLIGEFKRQDLISALSDGAALDSENVVFWSVWSTVLLGNKSAVDALEPFVLQSGPFQEKAIQLAFRVLPIKRAREWISKLTLDKEQTRAVIKAIGVLGDPHAVNWLLAQMQMSELARLAGEAFSMITGIDLEQQQFVIDPPEGIGQQPSDDPEDDNVSMDEDENLPWPDIKSITLAWQRYGEKFIPGQRYFMGRSISIESLQNKIMQGTQRQRQAAVMELAVMDVSQKLPNVKAKV